MKHVCDKSRLIAWIFFQPSELNLWPLSNINMAISLKQATESLKRYERYPIAEDGSTCYCASLFEIKSFDSIIAECEDSTLGLCLACVKLGRLLRG